MQVYRRESERQECAVEAEVEQRRPGGDHDFKYPDSETGLAEHRDDFQSTHQDTPGAQRDAGTPTCVCQRDAGTKIQEPQTGV